MNATAAAAPEAGSNHHNDDNNNFNQNFSPRNRPTKNDDPESHPPFDPTESFRPQQRESSHGEGDNPAQSETGSIKMEDSLGDGDGDRDSRPPPHKKRKRAASPPWTFPTAETATLKTADGRRVSARVHTSTPGLSETESRGRSGSQSANRSRPPSPPWKKFGADGPTTLRVDGLRKSGRVNKELSDPPPPPTTPKRVSPRSRKHVDPLGTPQSRDKKSLPAKSVGGSSSKKEQSLQQQIKTLDSPRGSLDSSRKIAELKAQIAALQPTRSFPAPVNDMDHGKASHKRKKSQDVNKKERIASPHLHRKTHRLSNAVGSPERVKPSPKIKLRLSAPRNAVPPPHPQAKMPSPVRPPQISLHQLIERFELQEMQQPFMDNDRGPPDIDFFEQRASRQAFEEGAMRKKLLQEAYPGGALSKEHLSLYRDDRQAEPPQQYGHHDHLVAHALYLRQLQQREKTQHRLIAKKLAYEAVDKWKTINGPTEEDILAEQNKVFELIKKQIVADMKAKWEMVEAHVQEMKRKAWEVEQERVRAEKLQKKLEWSENLLAKQRGDWDSDMDEDSTGDDEESDADGEDEDEDEDLEENMSESESESDANGAEEEGDMDENALAAYLVQREAGNPDEDLQTEPTDGHALGASPRPRGDPTARSADKTFEFERADSDRRASRRDRSASPTKEEIEAEEHLSSDESTDMYDSDEDMSSTGDEAQADDNEDDDDESDQANKGPSLLSLYSAKDLLRERGGGGGLPTPQTSVENGGDNENPRPSSEARSDENIDAEAAIAQQLNVDFQPDVDVHQEHTKSEGAHRLTPAAEENQPEETANDMELVEELTAKSLVPTPTLLRGTLRTYQHAGLDWLASLYRNGTNGILADEMGLGKTIQTISLLAHLAEVHEVWETHLVIVPTSVILNWVTEFHKFLPGFRVLGYYGTAEERHQKRRGWTNDPHHEQKEKRGYNVVITSYNVAMQDINAIRNVQWHYLILDEAHNIRNFNSQRWQVLIRLRTRARLLLTGTPLQNDLAEVWSLLTFLTAGDDDRSHGELEEFLGHWKDPVKEIFDQGVQKISDNAQRVVDQLHISLRPFLLRRKKSEVEKDLPKKTESVVVCKLSKRQRQLYQDYMGLAETRATLAKGSGVQAGAVLLSLRRVCNHPDLFDPRPIETSFAMENSPLDLYSSKEQLVRRLLSGTEHIPTKLVLIDHEGRKRQALERSKSLAALDLLLHEVRKLENASRDISPDPCTLSGSRALQRLRQRERKLQQLRACIRVTENGLAETPMYGSDLRELVTIDKHQPYLVSHRRSGIKYLQGWPSLSHRPLVLEHPIDWSLAKSMQLRLEVATLDSYAARLKDIIVRFTFVPPAATVPILNYAIPPETQNMLRCSIAYQTESDFGHESRVRTAIAFPDSRLLIYDSGKLQRLVYLLRELQSRGSRSLIFTQMTGTLNILEQFLNLLNLPYLRLDGSTPVERRQLYSAEFNRPDSRYQCMILSSRAGGVGLNLTGASSVIFYDLDWNPQMDRQCMDRAHRIGQVRDVEVYKMVSEKTVEENILRRANQKSLLDQTIIQEGHFTTEYQQKRPRDGSKDEDGDEVAAAIERFLGGEDKTKTKAMECVEDKEDVQAAQQAAKEDRQDDVDFAERSSKDPSKANTPGPGDAEVEDLVADELKGHIDLYMVKFMEQQLEKWVYVPPVVRKLDKHGRDPSHRPKKPRR